MVYPPFYNDGERATLVFHKYEKPFGLISKSVADLFCVSAGEAGILLVDNKLFSSSTHIFEGHLIASCVVIPFKL